MFTFAMNSPLTREKYTGRLAKFLGFIGITEGTIVEQCTAFAERGKKDFNWALNNILRFLQIQKQRVDRKEITGSTMRNYVKAIKLFCDMNDILIPWKKITRGLPKGRKYADDRAPTIDEINKIIQYPDRRIKAIVCTMASSGIRLGAWDYLQWQQLKMKKIQQ